MKPIYRVILVNGCTFVACLGMVYAFPPTMSLRAYGIICLLTFALMNGLAFGWPRDHISSDSLKPSRTSSIIKVILIWVLFLMSLGLLLLGRSRWNN
jgi:uncharacterized membrane-anchored protein